MLVARTGDRAAAGCRRRRGSGPRRRCAIQPISSGDEAQVERVHHAAGGRECRSSTRGGRGGSSTAWRPGRPSSGRAPAARCRGRACAGGTRRRCACAASCRAGARRSSLLGNSVPARSSRWLSDSGTSIIVERIMARLLAAGPRQARRSRARRAVVSRSASTSRSAIVAGAAAHAVAQPPFLDEAFAAVEGQGARVALPDVEPEAVRAEVAKRHLGQQPHAAPGRSPGPWAGARCASARPSRAGCGSPAG